MKRLFFRGIKRQSLRKQTLLRKINKEKKKLRKITRSIVFLSIIREKYYSSYTMRVMVVEIATNGSY